MTLLDIMNDEGGKFECIVVGDLIMKQITQKSEMGEKITDALHNQSYVPDEIVIQLVRPEIEKLEQGQKSWIIEGFPMTEVQAVALQKMGIIPDNFIMLD